MRIQRQVACRKDGKALIKIHLEGYRQDARFEVQALTPGLIPVPACLYPFKTQDDCSGMYVLELPLMEVRYVDVHIFSLTPDSEVDDLVKIRVIYNSIKWQSRFNHRLRKQRCTEILDIGQGFIQEQFQIKELQHLEGEDCVVWRFFIEWEGTDEASPMLSGLDSRGKPFDVEALLFEEQSLPGISSSEIPRRRRYLSVKLDKDLNAFSLIAEDALCNYRSGFCSIDQGTFEVLKYRTWIKMRDARAGDSYYQKWFAQHRVTDEELAKQRDTRFDYTPKISVVVPCFESTAGFLKGMIDSVQAQSYTNWEFLLLDASPKSGVVKHAAQSVSDKRIRYIDLEANAGIVANTNRGISEATGEYIAFLDDGDMIEANTLYEYVKYINEHPGTQLLFCDEDRFAKSGSYCQPVFKTQLNLDLLYSYNCVAHLLLIQASLLQTIGLSPDEVSDAQDYDLILRVIEADAEICHIPRMLYHCRQHAALTSKNNIDDKTSAEEAGRLVLEAHMERRGIAAHVTTTDHPFMYRVHYLLPTPHPQVDIIIPSKDHIDVLGPCIESIIEKSTYDNYRITIVENGSKQTETFEYYEYLQKEYPCVSVINWEHEFNYAKIINFGVQQTKSPYVLLLNNDTQVISADFIEEMLGYLQRPEVGVVGAKLYFRDGLVQHSGMLIGPYGAVAHVNQNFSAKQEGYLARAVRPGNYSSVTGACQMIRRSVFDEVGGYNEELAVGFNDVDFCLKVWKAGYRVVFSPYAELFHYEFVTRGRELADSSKQARWEQEQALFKQTWPECFEQGDPFTNPNLDRNSFYYALPEV